MADGAKRLVVEMLELKPDEPGLWCAGDEKCMEMTVATVWVIPEVEDARQHFCVRHLTELVTGFVGVAS